MNVEPQKFFISLMDFFSILVALLPYLLMLEMEFFVLWNDKYRKLAGAEAWAAFLSYLYGVDSSAPSDLIATASVSLSMC